MGYTHYFSHKKITKKKWEEITTDCIKLWENLPKHVLIDGQNAYPTAKFSGDIIFFNGTDKGFTQKDHELGKFPENGHETFVLKREGSDDFCKTARKPYDLMVCACLLVLAHYCPKMHLGSDAMDGNWKPTDGWPKEWKAPTKFVKKILGYEVTSEEAYK